MSSDWRPSRQSSRGIEAVIQAFKVRNINTDEQAFGVSEKLGDVLAKGVLEYPDTNGQISACKAWRRCLKSLEDDWSVVCGFCGC